MVMVRIPDDLRDLIDAARGDVPRERWVRRALEAALTTEGPIDYEHAGRVLQRAEPVNDEVDVPYDTLVLSRASTCSCGSRRVVSTPLGRHAGWRCLACGNRWKRQPAP